MVSGVVRNIDLAVLVSGIHRNVLAGESIVEYDTVVVMPDWLLCA